MVMVEKGLFRSLTRRFSSLTSWLVSSSDGSFAFLIGLLALTLVYRIVLTTLLFVNPVRPFDFNPGSYPPWFMLAYLPFDLVIIVVCFLSSWFLSRTRHFSGEGRGVLFLNMLGFLLLNVALFVLAVVHGTHRRLLFDVQTGFDASVLSEAFSGVAFGEVGKLIGVKEYLLLVMPIGIFWMIRFSPRTVKVWLARIVVTAVVLSPLVFILPTIPANGKVPREIRLNPAVYLVSDLAMNGHVPWTTAHPATGVSRQQASPFRPSGPASLDLDQPVKMFPANKKGPWNVILFVMESVGTRYMFDQRYGNPVPMPFLRDLAQRSWYLRRHYTTSNVSTKAVFSILSGLYDFFRRENFGTREDTEVPSIYNFIKDSHECFLVTPASLAWYFPAAFVKNSGLRELHHYGNLNFSIKEEVHSSLGRYIGRDEVQTTDFFVQRLKKAGEPFLGIYISFAAHFPYFDYGPEYRIMENDGQLVSRYYNNLHLLDRMIKRVYDALREQGRLERTILVIVGDHGQAFGQHHPDNFMHYRYSYGENLEAPAILHQPALFRPKVVEFPTSHVDILPTLLDAMGVPYNPALLDGESLFQNRLRRKYIFFYGHEGSISSLGTDEIKVQYSLKKKRGWAYDLRGDPDEKSPLESSSYPAQLETLHQFAGYHDEDLLRYNAQLREENEIPRTQTPVVLQVK